MTGRRLGMIARADNGGLGNLTWEFARHLHPDRVLVMDMGSAGRSAVHLDRYDGLDVRVVHGWGPDAADRRWLLDGCDVLYSAETFYADELVVEAARAGVHTVLHVMPELHLPTRYADEIWVPTGYRRDLLPPAQLVPVPVALDRFTFERRSPARHFVHLWAPAMADRNGTSPTLAALELVTQPVTVTILGAQGNYRLEGSAPVTIKSEPGHPDDYFDVWPPDADVLLLPRRYAGLSMPVQEAAARGTCAVMTAVEPQTAWPGVAHVPSRGSASMRMAGGMVDVADPDPVAIARTIDRLAADDDYAARLSDGSRVWAEALSWDVWADRYRTLLGLDRSTGASSPASTLGR